MGNGIGLAGAAAAGSPGSYGTGTSNAQFAQQLIQAGMDPRRGAQLFAGRIGLARLPRREVSLGAVRETLPPQDHIGLRIAPFKDVATDDVIFDYIKSGLQEGLAPARAEDAE